MTLEVHFTILSVDFRGLAHPGHAGVGCNLDGLGQILSPLARAALARLNDDGIGESSVWVQPSIEDDALRQVLQDLLATVGGVDADPDLALGGPEVSHALEEARSELWTRTVEVFGAWNGFSNRVRTHDTLSCRLRRLRRPPRPDRPCVRRRRIDRQQARRELQQRRQHQQRRRLHKGSFRNKWSIWQAEKMGSRGRCPLAAGGTVPPAAGGEPPPDPPPLIFPQALTSRQFKSACMTVYYASRGGSSAGCGAAVRAVRQAWSLRASQTRAMTARAIQTAVVYC